MRVYLSGPISGLDPVKSRALFDAAERELLANGHTVVNPWRLDDESGPLPSWADYMKRDIPILLGCDGIMMLDGWQQSEGAKLEYHIARSLGIAAVPSAQELPTGAPAVPAVVSLPSILVRADGIIHGARNAAYGPPHLDMGRTGKMIGALLGIDPVSPDKVAMIMIAVKLSRLCNTPFHEDSLIDIAGYAGTIEMMAQATGVWKRVA